LYYSLFFQNYFQDKKGTTMADPILESSLKAGINTSYCNIFLFQ